MVKFHTVFSHHRFEFLHNEVERRLGVGVNFRGSPVDKTMLWIGDELDVYWECHDGVRDAVPRESCARLYKILSVLKPTKPFLYVKPAFSPTRSIGHVELTKEQGGKLVTCGRWSYYPHYKWMFNDRVNLRKKFAPVHDVTFLGAQATNVRYDVTTYDCQPFEHGISRSDARSMFNVSLDPLPEESIVVEPSRHEQVLRLMGGTGMNCRMMVGLNAVDYVNEVLKTKMTFQPHGVGPRHAIYESMLLGVPSIIPECSYLDDATRSANLIVSEEITTEDCERVTKFIPDRQALIDTFERTMTPEAIVGSVLVDVEKFMSTQ